jgi:hypothetical protein
MDDPQVPLPNNSNPVKNRAKQYALRQYSGAHKGQVTDVAGGNASDPTENLAENHQPEDWLDSAGKKFGRIPEEFL